VSELDTIPLAERMERVGVALFGRDWCGLTVAKIASQSLWWHRQHAAVKRQLDAIGCLKNDSQAKFESAFAATFPGENDSKVPEPGKAGGLIGSPANLTPADHPEPFVASDIPEQLQAPPSQRTSDATRLASNSANPKDVPAEERLADPSASTVSSELRSAELRGDDMLGRKEAAQYLTSIGYPITVRTLANRATDNNAGGGPPRTKSGKRVKYKRSDLDEWVKGRERYIK
jgi:hypothetical protein